MASMIFQSCYHHAIPLNYYYFLLKTVIRNIVLEITVIHPSLPTIAPNPTTHPALYLPIPILKTSLRTHLPGHQLSHNKTKYRSTHHRKVPLKQYYFCWKHFLFTLLIRR